MSAALDSQNAEPAARRAAGEITFPPLLRGPLLQSQQTNFSLGFVQRDYFQSLHDLMPFMASRLPLKNVQALGKANAVTNGIPFSIFETGGGSTEGDYREGRHHVTALRLVHKDLAPSIAVRPLLRGEYVVTRARRHPRDIQKMMDIIRTASGVEDGRLHVEKIFDAQNDIARMRIMLDNTQKAFDEGKSVTAEIVLCFSARRHFDAEYYARVIPQIVGLCKGYPAVSRISVKDTVGYLRGETNEKGEPLALEQGNSAAVTRAVVHAMEALHEEQGYGPTGFAWHTHQSGHANDSAMAVYDSFQKMPRRFVKNLCIDALPGGYGFADPLVFIPGLKAMGHAIGIPPAQARIWREIQGNFNKISFPYGGMDANKYWSGPQLIQGGCAVGAQGSFDRLYVQPVANDFIKRNSSLFDVIGEGGKPDAQNAEWARDMIRGVAMRCNEWISDRAKLHSITPGADLMNQMAGRDRNGSGLLAALFNSGHLERFYREGFDPWGQSTEWWDKFIVENRFYENIKSAAAANYLQQPIAVKGGVDPLLADQLKPFATAKKAAPPVEIGYEAERWAGRMLEKTEQELAKRDAKTNAGNKVVPLFPGLDDMLLMYLTRFPDAENERAGIMQDLYRCCLYPEHSYPNDWITSEENFLRTAGQEDTVFYKAYKKANARTFEQLLAHDPQAALELYAKWNQNPGLFKRDWGLRRQRAIHNRSPQDSILPIDRTDWFPLAASAAVQGPSGGGLVFAHEKGKRPKSNNGNGIGHGGAAEPIAPK